MTDCGLRKMMKVRKLYEDDRSTKSFKIFYASCVSHNRLTDDKDNLKNGYTVMRERWFRNPNVHRIGTHKKLLWKNSVTG